MTEPFGPDYRQPTIAALTTNGERSGTVDSGARARWRTAGVRSALATILVAVTLALVGPGSGPASAAACSIGAPSTDYADEVTASARTARVWRLYQAYFLRQPDRAGLDYWLGVNRDGVSLQELSYYFERSDEFTNTYGSLDNAGFVTLVYANVLCRQPDPDGFAYWRGQLDAGAVDRGELMVLFSESNEFGATTGTRWSIFADPDDASWAADGYEVEPITGGLIVKVDYSRVDFRASHERCSVASINGNWFHNPETIDPTPIGYAVVDGYHLPGSVNRDDRGVFGERYRPNGPDEERVWVYNGSFNLNSNLEGKNGMVLESWRSWQPSSTPPLDNAVEWRWAAAGIPLIVNGQVWEAFRDIPTNDYTHYTGRHSFVAFEKATGILVFGSTTAMTSADLIAWAQAGGYDDLIKFDGGGSVELNIEAQARIAGTPRDVPLWLGIGC
ncbi:MAG: DUF4214 domain-containing protein [Acidimicrobiia bacterium]|nr:DUF4214 domain-containing protein [Acidimicrobiia bacterium]